MSHQTTMLCACNVNFFSSVIATNIVLESHVICKNLECKGHFLSFKFAHAQIIILFWQNGRFLINDINFWGAGGVMLILQKFLSYQLRQGHFIMDHQRFPLCVWSNFGVRQSPYYYYGICKYCQYVIMKTWFVLKTCLIFNLNWFFYELLSRIYVFVFSSKYSYWHQETSTVLVNTLF